MAHTHSTRRKVQAVADYLAPLSDDELRIAATFFSGSPFPAVDPRVLQVGWAVLRDAAMRLLTFDLETFRECVRVVGEPGETLEKLFRAERALFGRRSAPRARQRNLLDFGESPAAPAAFGLTLREARRRFEVLAATRGPQAKTGQVEEILRLLSEDPIAVKYWVKLLMGDMRIGLAESLVEEGIARAFGREVAAVRLANMLSGDIGHTAVLAREDRLHEAEFRLFHPLKFMLATPLDEGATVADYGDYLAEDKFDGIRCQLHCDGERVALFTRNQGDVTALFPEVVEAAKRVPGTYVLDGEVIAVEPSGRAASFAKLQRRLGRKAVPEALRREVPVRFVAYDLLHLDGDATYERPFSDRVARLDAMPLAPHLSRSRVHEVASREDVDRLFTESQERGNEGVMLKRRGSTYEFGKRGRAWLKLKRPFATLDVVITAAEMGHGKRAGLLSDYTFAVRGPEGRLVNVGKAYTGLTDEEIGEMTRRLKAITRERYGSVHVVAPEIVLEVAFDGVQVSERHASGYALRFPRIVRIRHDKGAAEADTLETVAALHRRQLGDEGTAAGATP